MFRRMPEQHKCFLLGLMNEKAKVANVRGILYDVPHTNDNDEQPAWPSNAVIELCMKLE